MKNVHKRSHAVTCIVLFCAGAVAARRARADTDWVLVLDRSESMTQNDPYNCRFDAQKIMVDLLAQGVQETHRLSIIRFAGTAEAVLDRELIRPENLDEIRRTIAEDPPKGDTDIGAALALARKVSLPAGRASDVHVILLSDGVQAGKIPNLAGRLEDEKKACQELALAVHTILLNDFSISRQDREERRKKKLYYEDKQLQAGEDLLRAVARKTGGQAAQVLPGRGIEDILIELIAPHMSFHREAVAGRLETWPTDRQLFLVLDRGVRDLRLRIGQKELDLSLDQRHQSSGGFNVEVNPYRNRAVVMIRPEENVRWPDWVEFLPGASQNVVTGDVFVISNVRLETLAGLDGEGAPAGEGVKKKIQENEVYPIRFRIAVADDLTTERGQSIQNTLKRSNVRIDLRDAEGKLLEEKALSAADVLAGAGNRLYFIPTSSPRGETKIEEPFSLLVRARLELGDAASRALGEKRPLCRAPDRSFLVTPSSFDWLVRRNWKGEPESSSRPLSRREVEIDLGQELRLEVTHAGRDPLGEAEMFSSFGEAGESAARRLPFRDGGGVPHIFFTDWIFPTMPGAYAAKMTVKAGGVQEAAFAIKVLRDDFRSNGSTYLPDGSDSARGSNLGFYLQGEKVQFSRTRTINRLTPEATRKYWETEAATQAKAYLLRKGDLSVGWTISRQAPLSAEPPQLGAAEITVRYRGELADLEPGEYLVAWPEKKPLGPDPAADQRSDRFEVKPRAFSAVFLGENGRPLELEGGKPAALAGSKLIFKVSPTQFFPDAFQGTITGLLTWARKDVGAPQLVKGLRGQDGSFSLAFPTTDFHTGPAKLRLSVAWKDAGGGRERSIEEDHEVFARTKALGIALDPLDGDVLIGQRGAAVGFRLRAIGGQNAQAQRDLLSVWQSQPANVTIGDSERIHRVDLAADGETLTGSLDAAGLSPGTYKLVVSSPLAKLGQDIAACFFNVRPCPFTATLVKSSLGTDQRVVLGPGVERASCEGEGAVWVSLERAISGSSGVAPARVASAELRLNGKKTDVDWSEADGKFRSEPFSLESLERQNSLVLSITDETGRGFDASLGKLEVLPVPLKYEIAWTKAPPPELGRGEHVAIEGELAIRGGLRSQREEQGQALRAARFFSAAPASALEGFEVLPLPAEAREVDAVFGVRIGFRAALNAAGDNTELKEGFTLTASAMDGAAIESRKVVIGPSSRQLIAGRTDPQGAVALRDELPFLARETLKLKIESQGLPGECRIQVFPAESGDASPPVASSDSCELSWAPRKDGVYRITAEAVTGPGSGWATEEKLAVLPSLKFEWARNVAGAIKLDDGQKLPLTVKISGPSTLDAETFGRWFALRPEVLGEGGQALNFDFSPWEPEKGTPPGTVVVSAFSSKPLSPSAVKVRVKLLEQAAKPDGAGLDALDLDIVRGGGSLVVVEHFERGPQGYVTRDLSSGFELPRQSAIRLGYRVGGMVEAEEFLKHGVAATVIASDGSDKVLDVEATGPGLVVFTPYEASRYGRHTLRLEIRGKAPLSRDFDFEVVKGTSERALVWAAAAAGAIFLVILATLGLKGLAYSRDRRKVLERVRARKEKALGELAAEPRESLVGTVRLNIANRAVGPIELNGTPSGKQVEAWVDQRFSMETAIFSDAKRNENRRELIHNCLAEARTELCLETEKRLPVRGADVCLKEVKDPKGVSRTEAEIVQDGPGRKQDGQKALLSLRLLPDGKLRISTGSGRSVVLSTREDFPYNGWVGKSGNQVRASVKVPGVADYSTVMIDLK